MLTQTEVRKAIADGVSKIINALLPKTKSLAHKLIDSIAALNPKITFNLLGQKLEVVTRQTTEKVFLNYY